MTGSQSWKNLCSIACMLLLLVCFAVAMSACHRLDDEGQQTIIGQKLVKAKKYDEAKAVFERSIARQETRISETRASGNGSDNAALGVLQKNKERDQGKLLAVTYNNLATVLYESGRYGEAETAFEKAITTYRLYFGRQHHFVIDCLNSLAASYYKQGKYVDAERYYLEELDLEKKLLKPDSLSIAVTSNNLAAIYQKLGDDVEAEKYFHWALNLCQGCKPNTKEKEQLADILNNLAVFYERTSNYPDARDMVNRALELEASSKSNVFSVNKARSLMVLASIEKATDLDLDASESHYQEALSLIESAPEAHPELLSEALEKYAELLLSERKFKEAEPIFERSIKTCIEAHGPDHPSVAERLSEYSLLLKRTDRFALAETKLREALAIQEKTIGVDTVTYLTTVHRLAAVLADQNRCKEADLLYQQILPKLKERLGPMHPFVADTMDNWAGYVEKCRNQEDADELRASAKLIRRKLANSLQSSGSSDKN